MGSMPSQIVGFLLPTADLLYILFFLNISNKIVLIDSTMQLMFGLKQAGISSPPDSSISVQKEWDDLKSLKLVESLLKPSLNQHKLACLNAAMEPKSGAWLNAIPCASLGPLLDKESLRIGVAVRLGLCVCSPHKCRCGILVDEFGLHPLSCRLSAGRFPRHSALNDINKRCLSMTLFLTGLFFILSLSKPLVSLVLLLLISLEILVVWWRVRNTSQGNASGSYSAFPYNIMVFTAYIDSNTYKSR